MPEIAPQNGGYIHVTASKPAWAWGIFGSADILASMPAQ
jgi:hypothetical protein